MAQLEIYAILSGLTASLILITGWWTGIITIFQAKRGKIPLLKWAGMFLLCAGTFYLGTVLSFFHLIFTGRNLPTFLVGQLCYFVSPIAASISMFVGFSFIKQNLAKPIAYSYLLLAPVYWFGLFFLPGEMITSDITHADAVGGLIDITLTSWVHDLTLFFLASFLVILVPSYLWFAKKSTGFLRKKAAFQATGFIIFVICGALDSLLSFSELVVVVRIVMASGYLSMYHGYTYGEKKGRFSEIFQSLFKGRKVYNFIIFSGVFYYGVLLISSLLHSLTKPINFTMYFVSNLGIGPNYSDVVFNAGNILMTIFLFITGFYLYATLQMDVKRKHAKLNNNLLNIAIVVLIFTAPGLTILSLNTMAIETITWHAIGGLSFFMGTLLFSILFTISILLNEAGTKYKSTKIILAQTLIIVFFGSMMYSIIALAMNNPSEFTSFMQDPLAYTANILGDDQSTILAPVRFSEWLMVLSMAFYLIVLGLKAKEIELESQKLEKEEKILEEKTKEILIQHKAKGSVAKTPDISGSQHGVLKDSKIFDGLIELSIKSLEEHFHELVNSNSFKRLVKEDPLKFKDELEKMELNQISKESFFKKLLENLEG